MGSRGGPVSDGRKFPLWSFVFLVLLAFALSGAALLVASNEVNASQARWCSTLVTLDNADRHAPPPATQFGRQLVSDFRTLRRAFGCG